MSADVPIPDLVPLFPLPECLLLPGGVTPLQVFEPRYLAMVHDSLRGDRFIALAVLREGFEPYYYTRHAPIHSTVCVGRIDAAERIPNDRVVILLHGVARARVTAESDGRPYRRARVSIFASNPMSDDDADLRLRRRLSRLAPHVGVSSDSVSRWTDQLTHGADLGLLTDIIAASIEMPSPLRQLLLEERDVERRCETLVSQMRVTGRIHRVRRRQSRFGRDLPAN